jgi:hypothetical protein
MIVVEAKTLDMIELAIEIQRIFETCARLSGSGSRQNQQ